MSTAKPTKPDAGQSALIRDFADAWLNLFNREKRDTRSPSHADLVRMLTDFLLPTMEWLEPETCGTRHITAERALRIVEAQGRLDGPITADAVTAIDELTRDAGVFFARQAIRRQDRFADIAGDVPF